MTFSDAIMTFASIFYSIIMAVYGEWFVRPLLFPNPNKNSSKGSREYSENNLSLLNERLNRSAGRIGGVSAKPIQTNSNRHPSILMVKFAQIGDHLSGLFFFRHQTANFRSSISRKCLRWQSDAESRFPISTFIHVQQSNGIYTFFLFIFESIGFADERACAFKFRFFFRSTEHWTFIGGWLVKTIQCRLITVHPFIISNIHKCIQVCLLTWC